MRAFLNIYLFADFLLWLVCIGMHKYFSNQIYDIGMDLELDKMPPLYDIFQESMPNLQSVRIIPEILHLIPIVILFGHIVYYRDHRSAFTLGAFLHKHGFLMVLRALFFSSTLLPDSSRMCKHTTLPGSCFDLIFSGHSTAILLCTYLLRDHYNLSKFKFLLLQAINLITCIMIIACRNHYTIDVLVSIIVTNYVYDM